MSDEAIATIDHLLQLDAELRPGFQPSLRELEKTIMPPVDIAEIERGDPTVEPRQCATRHRSGSQARERPSCRRG